MALIIKIYSNEKELAELAAVNVTETEFNRPYGKGVQDYEIYLNKEPQGIYIKHEFEKGFEPLAKSLVTAFSELLTIPK